MHWHVKQKLLFMISMLIFASVTLVTILTYLNQRTDLIRQSTQKTQLLLEQLAINTDTYLEELFRLCLSPYYNKSVMEQLQTKPETPVQKLQKQRVIEDFLGEVMTIPRSDILRALILTDGVYTSSKTRYDASIPVDFREEGWYQSAVSSAAPVFIPVHMETQGRSSIYVFSIAQKILSTKNASDVLGVIRVDANYLGIKNVCDRAEVTQGNALYILDSQGNQIYANSLLEGGTALQDVTALLGKLEGEGPFFEKIGRSDYVISVKTLQSADWRMIDIHSTRELTRDAAAARDKAILWAFLCAAGSVLFSVVLVKLFLKPIFEITGLMQKVQKGDLTVRAQVSGTDELNYLASSFNEMTEQLSAFMEKNDLLTRQVYEAKYLEKEAQYAALCSQIRPHFLFNALNTINLLIKCGRPPEASQCIDHLSTLLRGMVNTDRDITLSAEMKIVESYLLLQKMRYGTLAFEITGIEAFQDYILPAMTVQPLVENALVHGCEPKRGGTRIAVTAAPCGEELHITVEDNGVGMGESQLMHIRESLAENTSDLSDSGAPPQNVGLINISRRVKLKFGLAYGLSIDSALGQGTKAVLRLPLKPQEGMYVQGTDR
jgi:two-component system sensor histidine kinase YesM